ncbi:hypothetical protein [Colwellia sp. C1TZA3]|nr:hypothetical protein [Colwellia sp. C1TZA3]
MEWLNTLLQPETFALLIAIVGAFSVAALKAHHRHQERIEKIKNGFNPEL